MFFQNILENLNDQIEYYLNILELSKQEQEAIMAEDINKVSMIVEQQKKMYAKAAKAENMRIQLILESERFSGKEDVALDDIINICTDAKLKDGIIKAKDELVSVIREQKYLNVMINQLLSTNLEYYDFILTAMSSEITPNNIYTSTGDEAAADKSAVKIFDSEV